jgi:hypothetical protein
LTAVSQHLVLVRESPNSTCSVNQHLGFHDAQAIRSSLGGTDISPFSQLFCWHTPWVSARTLTEQSVVPDVGKEYSIQCTCHGGRHSFLPEFSLLVHPAFRPVMDMSHNTSMNVCSIALFKTVLDCRQLQRGNRIWVVKPGFTVYALAILVVQRISALCTATTYPIGSLAYLGFTLVTSPICTDQTNLMGSLSPLSDFPDGLPQSTLRLPGGPHWLPHPGSISCAQFCWSFLPDSCLLIARISTITS